MDLQAELNTIIDVFQGCFAALLLLVIAAAAIVVPILFPKLAFLFVWNKFLGAPIWKFFFEKRIKMWWRSKRTARRALPKKASNALMRGSATLGARIRSLFP